MLLIFHLFYPDLDLESFQIQEFAILLFNLSLQFFVLLRHLDRLVPFLKQPLTAGLPKLAVIVHTTPEKNQLCIPSHFEQLIPFLKRLLTAAGLLKSAVIVIIKHF